MNLHKELLLKELFPSLYLHLNTGFECRDGWFDLIANLSKDITAIIQKHEESDIMYATQVKEKYGGLRFYMSCETDEISDLIVKAEELSLTICELCGNPGKINGARWYEVVCQNCE